MDFITLCRVGKSALKVLWKKGILRMSSNPLLTVTFERLKEGVYNGEWTYKGFHDAVGVQAIIDTVQRVVKDPSPNREKGTGGYIVKVDGKEIARIDGLSLKEMDRLQDKVTDGFKAFRPGRDKKHADRKKG